MISAKQAAQQAVDSVAVEYVRVLNEINDKILNATKYSGYRTTYPISSINLYEHRKEITEKIIDKLTKLGFKVDKEESEQSADRGCIAYLVIKWDHLKGE